MATLNFYLDYISPYAYVAWTQVRQLAAAEGITLVPRPILFAGVLNAHGQKGPAEIPAKRLYVFRDIRRSARALGVPIHAPFSHPFNPLGALRLTEAAADSEVRCRVVDRLFEATWRDGQDVSSPDVLAKIAAEIGMDPADAVSPGVKERLKKSTEAAIAKGVFGVPTMTVDDQLFWGLDSLGHLKTYLTDGDPLAGDDEAPWRAVRPTAVRRPKST